METADRFCLYFRGSVAKGHHVIWSLPSKIFAGERNKYNVRSYLHERETWIAHHLHVWFGKQTRVYHGSLLELGELVQMQIELLWNVNAEGGAATG